ncbi:VOC family protein [Testudinibacter sp. TR-2022]|uniref:VOC family protein n=1 Tax=Testudinibacter sp. TR-2022 TaxID=2585029 RepID=UPI00111BA8F0|nr:VOC family protein [Testudinibacter sp. TR-2022]TNH08090.1 VOC family protein [Pasteurellaceae bacterium Phil11]TNH24180.1 VOC family protein [Testudinibacter sp. TR-2022]TNH24580.1 VOC family protein [Testudinibacter sp. TR-2022]
MIKITALDHLVLTVADLQRTLDFYTRVLGMQEITFGEKRKALLFGQQKINLHVKGNEIEPKAAQAVCGSADLCLLTSSDLNEVITHLQQHHIEIIDAIVPRSGALGKIESVYLRDPDGNLLEISRYL